MRDVRAIEAAGSHGGGQPPMLCCSLQSREGRAARWSGPLQMRLPAGSHDIKCSRVGAGARVWEAPPPRRRPSRLQAAAGRRQRCLRAEPALDTTRPLTSVHCMHSTSSSAWLVRPYLTCPGQQQASSIWAWLHLSCPAPPFHIGARACGSHSTRISNFTRQSQQTSSPPRAAAAAGTPLAPAAAAAGAAPPRPAAPTGSP